MGTDHAQYTVLTLCLVRRVLAREDGPAGRTLSASRPVVVGKCRNIHRVFVVEKVEGGGLKPRCVITQRDMLRFLLFKLGLAPIWEIEPLP